MGPIQLSRGNKWRAIGFAVLGSALPVAIATITDFSSHPAVFFFGAALALIAPIVVTVASRRHGLVFYAAAFGGIPAMTMMQAYTGGVDSGYSVLLMMAMVWFGLQATDREILGGALVLAACCFLPMVILGAPAYPVSWGHATLLVLIGSTVAGSLRTLTREMQTMLGQLKQEAVIDDLTGLLNRRGWRYVSPVELARSGRDGNPIALVTIDLDHFKELNDQLGHDQGDRVLRDTADRIRATLRAGDVVARLGGDEFVALLTNSTLTGALTAIQRLREATPKQESFSAGVAVWDRREELPELLRRSDLALYAAKASGGGVTEVAPAALTQVPAGASADTAGMASAAS
jgi:diguanylate cyclase (GGDEF)-like protein